MAIEDLRVIGNVLYERRSDGLLYPVRQVAGQTPAQSQPQAPQGLLSGIPELGRMVNKLGLLNRTFNPVEGIGQSMDASRRMVAPDTSTMGRVTALGDMLSGVAGVATPAAVASRAGTPAAVAFMEGLLGGSPTVTAARDTARAAGRGFVERMNQPGPVPTMYSNPVPGWLGGEAGIRAYHGSPHSFDKFSMDKIGTGEGAQAYGHGLYFAENESVAKGYRDDLTGNLLKIGGKNYQYGLDATDAIDQLPSLTQKAKDELRWHINRGYSPDEALKNLSQIGSEKDIISLKSAIDSGEIGKTQEIGSLYEVKINADQNAMLDWDNPLGQQSDAVRAAFSSLGTPERLASVKGENAYRALQDQSGAMDWPVGASLAERNAVRQTASENVRQKLLEAGIPGIKYLDQGSRDKAYTVNLAYKGKPFEQGQFEPQFARSKEEADSIAKQYQGKGYDTKIEESGTRNFVVFDEKLISIVRKYGIAGAAAMLGVSAVDVEEAMARGQPPQGLLSMGSK